MLRGDPRKIVLVRAGVAAASGDWAEHTPAVRSEVGRLLEHIAGNGGRIDVADLLLAFRRVTLTDLPAGWVAEARAITTRWRPPAAR